MLLLEALTHRSAKEQLEVQICYEKLEVLGDSILDFLCNYTLLHYTLFERYITKDFD
jgi:dsRNA-specific ribonuclease